MKKITALSIYHRLPYPLRMVAATLRGVYLQRGRYGRETEQLVEEALERETWSRERWQEWREERLAIVLGRAATQVPYYREQWAGRRHNGDRSSSEYLENWPILEKDRLRQTAGSFVAQDCKIKNMVHEQTSGTTGTPLDIWWSRHTVRAWYALFEARWRRWYGVSRRNRWAILGGQLVTPVRQRRPPFWVWNPGLNQLYMSSYHLAPELIPYYLDALADYRVTYLFGYTSSLYSLALEAIRTHRTDLKMLVVVTNAEPVYEYQRQAIAQAFESPVRETYGMTEIVAAAGECEHGRLHLWPEVGIVEVLERGRPAKLGDAGDLVCTGLLNTDMPLIRYHTGDRGILGKDREECGCGRSLPTLGSLAGRADDVLITMEGRRIGRLDTVFKNRLPISEGQIIQESFDRVRVLYVPANGFDSHACDSIVAHVRERMGPVQVELEAIESIPRGPNGKFRSVICQIPEYAVDSLVNCGVEAEEAKQDNVWIRN